ncbi:zonular occludens toxin domain-containing protein [Comamonas testosteroni]|uniref:zonular occludens toxin domain-containing protein n=1 Tax=Comamonas testosteroni TaxID=285 RepID=UPI0026E96220|nr:zonular occludens toxin domain-containing protein [Comamonas testosteroni]
MAISVITGLMGSGKSHQAVKYIIVPNYKKGRKILTNIKGINEEELRKYCLQDKSIKEEDLGKIIIITDNNINKENFYPYLTEENNKEIIHDEDSFVKSGDVVVIDEAAQFYSDNLSKETLVFFTMHRHFTNEKHLSCELCFLVQDHSLLNRKLVKLCKNIYICKKLDFLGFAKSYTLKIYDGGTVRKQSLLNTKTEKYDKNIFPIYSSYAKGVGKEMNLDKRANILNNWKTWVVLGFVVALPFVIYKTFSTIKNHGKKEEQRLAELKQQSNIDTTNPQGQLQSNTQHTQNNSIGETQSLFRIAGVIDLPTKRLVMLEDENHNLRMIQPQLCVGKGLTMTCTIDNKLISYYNRLNNKEQKNENKNNNNNSSSNTK